MNSAINPQQAIILASSNGNPKTLKRINSNRNANEIEQIRTTKFLFSSFLIMHCDAIVPIAVITNNI